MVMRSSLRGMTWLKLPKRLVTDICFMRLVFFVSCCCIVACSLSYLAPFPRENYLWLLYFGTTVAINSVHVKQPSKLCQMLMSSNNGRRGLFLSDFTRKVGWGCL